MTIVDLTDMELTTPIRTPTVQAITAIADRAAARGIRITHQPDGRLLLSYDVIPPRVVRFEPFTPQEALAWLVEQESASVEIEDVPAQLVPTSTVIDGVPMMDATEARAVVTRIKTRIDIARGELLELHDREGWKALGYRNWETCARQEFGGSAAQMYRLLSAAQIERAIDSPIGEYPESHLREVATLDTPDQQKQALVQARAKTNGAPTAKDVRTEVDAIAGRTPADLRAAGIELVKYGAWYKAVGDGWKTAAMPFTDAILAAREEIAKRTAVPAAPDLPDILKRLDAHGYAKSSTRQKGITTFYSFRDYSGRSDETGGEVELAEGELPLWLAELDSHAAYAQAKQERYLDAQARADRLGYTLRRDGSQFVLSIAGQAQPALRGTLDSMIKTIEGYERNATKKAAADPATELTPEEQRIVAYAGYEWQSSDVHPGKSGKSVTYHLKSLGSGMGVSMTRPQFDAWLKIHAPIERPAAPTLAELDALGMPSDLLKAGYYWQSATPPTIAQNGSNWRGEAPTPDQALQLAYTRERRQGEPLTVFPALNEQECKALIREAKVFIERGLGRDYPTLGQALRIAARMALEATE
jgi:hypothetical protein